MLTSLNDTLSKPVPFPTIDDVHGAAERLRGIAHRTPVIESRILNEASGARLFFKCEHLQRMGAFKFRGAYNAIAKLPAAQRRAGVVTYSSGNHAQATALSARLHGIPATILMPHDSAASKVAATRGYGAEVIFYDRFNTDRDALGAQFAQARGLTMIPPYDHPDIVAGQGTAALELLEDVPELDVVVTSLGGGGLLSGTAVAVKGSAPRCRLYGVEPVNGDDGVRSLHAGHIVHIAPPTGLPEGALATHLGSLNFAIIQQFVTDIVTVTDAHIVEAMKAYAQYTKQIIEPTGAMPLAAVLGNRLPVAGLRVGIIISGGNLDLSRFAKLLTTES